jgi:hypothetical protein
MGRTRQRGSGDLYEHWPRRLAVPLSVKSYTFWDMERWESGLYVIAKAYAERGWPR